MKRFQYLTLAMVLLALIFAMVACDNSENKDTNDTAIDINYVVDGAIIGSVKFNENTFMPMIAPDKANKYFSGWFFDVKCNLPLDTTKVKEHATNGKVMLYAGYLDMPTNKDMVTLSFVLNVGEPIENMLLEKGAPFILPTPKNIVNYTFLGWFIDEDCTDNFDSIEAAGGIEENTVLYGKFEENSRKISLYVDGDVIDEISFKMSNPPTEITTPKKSGYIFRHWIIQGSEVEFDLAKYLADTNATDVALDAVFIKDHNLIEYYNGDTLVHSEELPIDAPLELISLDGDNRYDFAGWLNGDNIMDDTAISAYNNAEIRDDLTLIAYFTDKITCVTFVDGDNSNEIIVDSNLNLEIPKELGQENMLFEGWYIVSENDNIPFDKDAYLGDKYRSDMTVTAIYSTPLAHVTFMVDGVIANEQIVNATHPLIMPELAKPGYKLAGLTSNGKPFEIERFNDYLGRGNVPSYEMEITAEYEPIRTRIQFFTSIDANEEYDNIVAITGKNITMPKDPVMENATFVGWYLDKELTKPFDLNEYLNDANRVNIVVYAKFV